jgi:hypothetical protein
MTIKSMDKLSSSLNVIISFLTKGIIFLMPLFFLPWTVEYFEYNKQFLLWMMSLILLIIWLVKIIVAEKISYKKTLLDVPIGVFLLFGTIAAVLSIDTFSSWFGYYGNFSDAWIGTICLALFYFILIHFINNQKKIISYLKIFIYSSGVAILVALLSMCGLFADWMAWSFNTISGSFNNLVVFNAAVSVLILGVLCFCSDTFKKYEKFIFQLILSGALIGMCLFSLWQAWVVLLVGALILLALIFLTDKKWFTIKRNFLAGGLILLAVSFIYFSDINLDNFFLGRNLPQEITLPLAESAKISSSAFLDQPLFGSGPGTFAYDFSLYRPADFNSADVWQLRFDKSGSYFLEMLATKGALASLSLFVLIGIFLFFCAIAFWKSKKEKINLFVALFPGFFAVLVIYAICPTFTVTRF